MTEYILLGAMALVAVGLFLLKTHTGVVFLALCAGSVLVEATGKDLGLVASSLSSGLSVSTDLVRIIVLLAPAVVCAIFMRGYLTRGKAFFGLIPGIATALLAGCLVVPLLSQNVQNTIGATDTWKYMQQYQEFVVAFGLVMSVLMIILMIKKPDNDKDSHKKGHH